MAKIITGVGGTVTFATGYVLNADTWSLSGEADEHDLTDFTSVGWAEYAAGLKRWSGTYTAFVDDTTQLDANANWFGGTAAGAVFDMDGTRTLTGEIVITGFTVDTTTADPVKVTFTYRGNSTLTVN